MLRLVGTTCAMLLSAVVSYAQSPEAVLSELSPDHQAWVNRSCPKSLPTFVWTNCITREATAVSPGIPDLSRLSPDERSWVLSSCPTSWLPPSLAISCLNRELQAISAGVPSLTNLSPKQSAWVQNACPASLPPSLYRPCVTREAAVASGVVRSPTAGSISPAAIAVPPLPSQPTEPIRRADADQTEVSRNDEISITKDEKHEAKADCSNMEDGDPMTSGEGSGFGTCESAVKVNSRPDEKCEASCE